MARAPDDHRELRELADPAVGRRRQWWNRHAASQLIGGRQIERDDISRSRTRGKNLSRSMSMQTRREIEDVALASEIMQLANRKGFVKRAASPDWVLVKFPYSDLPLRIEPFVPAD
jgi:hypothetical protein